MEEKKVEQKYDDMVYGDKLAHIPNVIGYYGWVGGMGTFSFLLSSILTMDSYEAVTGIMVLILNIMRVIVVASLASFGIFGPIKKYGGIVRQRILLSVSFLTIIIYILVREFVVGHDLMIVYLMFFSGMFVALYFMYMVSPKVKQFYKGEIEREKSKYFMQNKNFYLMLGYILSSAIGGAFVIVLIIDNSVEPMILLRIVVLLVICALCYKFQTLSK